MFYRCFEGENRETTTDAKYGYGFGVFAGGTQFADALKVFGPPPTPQEMAGRHTSVC